MTNPKNPKSKPRSRRRNQPGGPAEWAQLFAAFRDALEWTLDVAVAIARDYPEEVAAVERVRTYMRKRIAGEPAHLATDDLMFTFALIVGAIERDLGPIAHLGPHFLRPPMRFPSADERGRHPTAPHYFVWSLDASPITA